MANTIDFKKILQNISADNVDVFSLPKGDFYIFNDANENQILSYITLNSLSGWEQFKNKADQLINRGTRSINDFFADVYKNIRAVETTIQTFKFNESVESVAQVPVENQNLIFVSLNFDAKIIVLETGLGKDFVWSKVLIFDNESDPSFSRQAYCLTSSLKIANNRKLLINYDINPFANFVNARLDKLTPKSLSSRRTISFDTRKDEVLFDDSIAAYYVAVGTELQSFSNLTEEEVTAVIKRAYKKGIKKILNANSRSQTNEQNIDYDDLFYCVASVHDFFLSPRAGQGLSILIFFPYRNILAVSQPVARPISGISEDLKSVVNNSAQLIQKASDAINGLSIDLNSSLSQETIDALNLNGVGSVADYLLPENAALEEERVVILDNDQDSFLKKMNHLTLVLKEYSSITQKYLDENENAKFFIDLNVYSVASQRATNILQNALFNKNKKSKEEYQTIQFLFSKGALKDIYFSNNQLNLSIDDSASIVESSPFADITFSVLLSNINKIYSIDISDRNINAVIDFLESYIYPEEYAQSILNNPEEQTNASCFKDQVKSIKDQAKKRTRDSIRKTQLKESIDNIKKSGNFLAGGEEFKKTKELLNIRLNGENGSGGGDISKFKDLKTINWNQMIEVATNCISDKETREIARVALDAIRRSLLNDTPLLCNIPRINLPQFPYIGLPRIPTIGSLVTSYYNKLSQAAFASRDDAVRNIIQGILDALGACEVPSNIDQEGEEDAENLFGRLQQPISPEEEKNARKSEFLNAGVFRSEEEADQKIDQIRLFLSEISKVLTKNELIVVLSGVLENMQYVIIKDVVEKLNSERRIDAIYNDISTETKLQLFLSNFSDLIREDVYGEFFQNNPFNTGQDIDFICKDTSDFEAAMIRNYLERGLSNEQILELIDKRRNDVRSTVNRLVDSINKLNLERIETRGANCKVNPDGSISSGVVTDLGLPQPFLQLRKTFIKQLFWPFEKAFNEELSVWFDQNSETIIQSQPNPRIQVQFFKTLNDEFENIYRSSSINLSDYSNANTFITATETIFAPLKIKSYQDRNDQEIVPSGLNNITDFDFVSNDVTLSTKINYSINNFIVNRISSSVNCASLPENFKNPSTKFVTFSTADKLYSTIFSIIPLVEDAVNVYNTIYKPLLEDFTKLSQYAYFIATNDASIESRYSSPRLLPLGHNREFKSFISPASQLEEQNVAQALGIDFSELRLASWIYEDIYKVSLSGRLDTVVSSLSFTTNYLNSLLQKIDNIIYSDARRFLESTRDRNRSPLDADATIIRNNFGLIDQDLTNFYSSVVQYLNTFSDHNFFLNYKSSIDNNDNNLKYSQFLQALSNLSSDYYKLLSAYSVLDSIESILLYFDGSDSFNTPSFFARMQSLSFEQKFGVEFPFFLESAQIIFNSYDKSSLQKSEIVVDLTNPLITKSINFISENTQETNIEISKEIEKLDSNNYAFYNTNIKNFIINNFVQNPFLKLKSPQTEIFGFLLPELTFEAQKSAVNRLDLVVNYTSEDEKCGREDERLINILPALKQQIANISADPCYTPKVREDGTVEDSPTFIATYSALFQTVLRLYAIETCLKLIPFINFLYLLNNKYVYEIFYFNFINTATNKFGPQFIDAMFDVLAAGYINENALQLSKDEIKNNPTFRKTIFEYHFRTKHFSQTNNLLKKIVSKEINLKYIPEYNIENRLLSIYEKANKKVTTIAEYLFFKDVMSFLYGTNSTSNSNIKVFVVDRDLKITYPLTPDGLTPEKLNLSDRDIFLKNLSDFKRKIDEYIKNFERIQELELQRFSIIDSNIPAAEKFEKEQSIIGERNNIIDAINASVIPLDTLFYEKLYVYLTNIESIEESPDVNLIAMRNLYSLWRDTESQKRSEAANTGAAYADTRYIERYDEYLSYQFRIVQFINNLVPTGAGKKYFLVASLKTPSQLETEYFREEITEGEAINFIGRVTYPKALLSANKVYNDIFTYVISSEEIFANAIMTYFLVASSYKAYENGFVSSKSKLNEIYSIIKSTNDFNFTPEIDFGEAASRFFKCSAKLALNTVKNYAAATDPNIAVSNVISKAYGISAVELAKRNIQLPMKNLPLWVPSIPLNAAGLLLTPTGIAADVISAGDSFTKLFGSDGLDSLFEENKKKC
jgi:hypothetical protein